jgi:hypothetical protein
MMPNHPMQRASAGVLGIVALAAGTAALVATLSGPASAAGDTSSAYALFASGNDNTGELAAISSSGATQSASLGSYRSQSGTFTSTGMTSTARVGAASATVADLVVAGVDLGSFSATCHQGDVTTHHSSASTDPARKIHVSYGGDGFGSGTAATVTLSGTGGAAETITVAHVACAQAVTPPPTSQPPTTNPVSHPPTTRTAAPPPSTGGHSPARITTPNGGNGEQPGTIPAPAPAPTPSPGRIAVTG